MFVLSCLAVPNTAYFTSSLIVWLLFYSSYYIKHSQTPRVPLYKRQTLPERFSHALKMHIFSNTNPHFPKMSFKMVSDAFPNKTWLDRCMQVEGWSQVQLCIQPLAVSLLSVLQPLCSFPLGRACKGKGSFVDYPCRSCTWTIVNQSEESTECCQTLC